MAPIPSDFQFSQGSLQDYVDCKRRFQLRFVLMQPWPALVAEPAEEAEQHLQRGIAFHLLAHQHALGLDHAQLASSIHDPTLSRWWQTFLDHAPTHLPATLRRAETVLAAPLEGQRLVAKFDLLAADPGRRAVVVDWKTSLRRPPRTVLEHRLQTRVYRYLVVEAGSGFNGGENPPPDRVEMVYWYAEFDGAMECFPYNAEQYAADQGFLASLIREITTRSEEIWPLTDDAGRCQFCNYRSLCDRGAKPGFFGDLDEDLEPIELQIDLEQIAEVAF
jgi:CRISPR/Cas system-associated exonuclease Cas4 (RecB family)